LATISNLYIDQGTDYSSIITVKSATGMPLDLTDYSVKSQIRKSYNSSQAFELICEIIDAPKGKLRISLFADINELMKPGRWLYDIEITQISTNRKKRVVEGIVQITPQITKI